MDISTLADILPGVWRPPLSLPAIPTPWTLVLLRISCQASSVPPSRYQSSLPHGHWYSCGYPARRLASRSLATSHPYPMDIGTLADILPGVWRPALSLPAIPTPWTLVLLWISCQASRSLATSHPYPMDISTLADILPGVWRPALSLPAIPTPWTLVLLRISCQASGVPPPPPSRYQSSLPHGHWYSCGYPARRLASPSLATRRPRTWTLVVLRLSCQASGVPLSRCQSSLGHGHR